MHVQVGPVSSASVIAWVGYARAVLGQVGRSDPATIPMVSADAVTAFERYLTTWAEVAARDATFVWTAEVDPEEVEFLAYTWFTLAGQLQAGSPSGTAARRGLPTRPDASEEFFQSLVRSMLDALADEGRSLQEFAEQLRDDWPGLQPP